VPLSHLGGRTVDSAAALSAHVLSVLRGPNSEPIARRPSHGFSQQAIDSFLVSLPLSLEPGENIGIQPDRQ
jgi:hypothetical protein